MTQVTLYFKCYICAHRFDLREPPLDPRCPVCGNDCRLYGLKVEPSGLPEDEADAEDDCALVTSST